MHGFFKIKDTQDVLLIKFHIGKNSRQRRYNGSYPLETEVYLQFRKRLFPCGNAVTVEVIL